LRSLEASDVKAIALIHIISIFMKEEFPRQKLEFKEGSYRGKKEKRRGRGRRGRGRERGREGTRGRGGGRRRKRRRRRRRRILESDGSQLRGLERGR
jgi:hypothetical protein